MNLNEWIAERELAALRADVETLRAMQLREKMRALSVKGLHKRMERWRAARQPGVAKLEQPSEAR